VRYMLPESMWLYVPSHVLAITFNNFKTFRMILFFSRNFIATTLFLSSNISTNNTCTLSLMLGYKTFPWFYYIPPNTLCWLPRSIYEFVIICNLVSRIRKVVKNYVFICYIVDSYTSLSIASPWYTSCSSPLTYICIVNVEI
jgi:hypothetical protein